MNIKSIDYPTPIAELHDIHNDNVDVIVKTDDGMTYTFVVTTPSNYYWYMDKEGIDYIPASPPKIVVRSLTDENIRKAVASYIVDNGYWLKLYFLAGDRNGAFDIELMNAMIEEYKKKQARCE